MIKSIKPNIRCIFNPIMQLKDECRMLFILLEDPKYHTSMVESDILKIREISTPSVVEPKLLVDRKYLDKNKLISSLALLTKHHHTLRPSYPIGYCLKDPIHNYKTEKNKIPSEKKKKPPSRLLLQLVNRLESK